MDPQSRKSACRSSARSGQYPGRAARSKFRSGPRRAIPRRRGDCRRALGYVELGALAARVSDWREPTASGRVLSFSLGMARSDTLSGRVQRRVRALHARARYRLGVPFPSPGDVSIAPRFRHPIKANHQWTVTQYRDRFPDGVGLELAEAARLAAHRFTLLGHTMQFAGRIAWSRDPVSGRDWRRGFSADIPYRGHDRLG